MSKIRVIIPKHARRGDFIVMGMTPMAAFQLGRELGERHENIYPIVSDRVKPTKGEQVIGSIYIDERHDPREVVRETIDLMEGYNDLRYARIFQE